MVEMEIYDPYPSFSQTLPRPIYSQILNVSIFKNVLEIYFLKKKTIFGSKQLRALFKFSGFVKHDYFLKF